MAYSTRQARRKKFSQTRRRTRERRATREKRSTALANATRPSPPAEQIKVEGVSDQNGNKWLLVSRGETSALVKRNAYFGQGNSFWSQLADQDVPITRSSSRSIISQAIEDIESYPKKVYVATRPGYHSGVFVKPDGTRIGEPIAPHFRVVLSEPKITLSQQGSRKSWKRVARTFARGQVVYTTLLCAAFVGPVLELFPGAENVCLWLESETTTGKSTGLDLFSSVWGAPHQQSGSLGISLRSTSAGLEQHIMARAATIFAADEVNLLGQNSRQQGERVYDLAFMASHGVEKERHKTPAEPRVQLSCLITSNTSLPSNLAGQEQRNVDAVLVRFITIPADAGANYGAFDRVPNGFPDSTAAIQALKEALATHHGWAADAFLAKWVAARREDEAGLKAKLIKYRDKFLRWSGVDRSDHPALRRAQSFAMIYAAGQLAVDWHILPLNRLKKLLLVSFRRSASAHAEASRRPGLTALERVRAYMEANRAQIRDLDKRKYRRMSDARLKTHPGFLKTIKGRRYLLMSAERWNAEFGAACHRLLKELETQGLLYITDGLQTQTRVRRNKDKDRIYAIQIA